MTQGQRTWVSAAALVGALATGAGGGWAIRGGRDEVARPQTASEGVTAVAEPAPTVTVHAEPRAAVTVTATAEPASPVTVTASASLPSILTTTVATPDCLRALDLADQGFRLAQRGFTVSKEVLKTTTDAVEAASRGNFGAVADLSTDLSAGSAELTTLTDDINALTVPYNSARAACVNR
ncbi:MAG: hypothetical protein ABIM89_05295 [Mycobacteriales bacterium]